MRNDYEMVTVRDYVNSIDNVRYTSVSEVEIEKEVEKYLLNKNVMKQTLRLLKV